MKGLLRFFKHVLSVLFIVSMGMPALPAGAWGPEGSGGPAPRVTDNASDLIVPEGQFYELCGCHTYSGSVQVYGTLNVTPYNGTDDSTGTLWLAANTIIVGPNGTIAADGRGYGGGGGGSGGYYIAGSGGKGGMGGAGASCTIGSGGGGGSCGGAGGTGGWYGTDGMPGSDKCGGKGGDYPDASVLGGLGGSGFGGGGGGGAGFKGIGEGSENAGGGGGGGTGGQNGSVSNLGGNGAGSAAGAGGAGEMMWGHDGGYNTSGGNGDNTTDLSIWRGSGGGGGSSCYAMPWAGGGGGGGAGGGSIALVSFGCITIAGSITSNGGGGGGGGRDIYGIAGAGGGGAGGGILLCGQKVNVSGSIWTCGRTGNILFKANGGTLKIFCTIDQYSCATIVAGRIFTSVRPRMEGLLSPGYDAIVHYRPEFFWKNASDLEGGALRYDLQISNDSSFDFTEFDIEGLHNTSFSPQKNIIGGPFYWRVRARDEVGCGEWSDIWRFVTDEAPPVSHVNPMPKFTTTDNFTVCWNGTDDFSGISGYQIFAAEDGGGFQSWINGTKTTSAVYQGRDGHRYSFCSVAFDKGNNREADHASADACTTVDATPPASRVASMPTYPKGATFNVIWSGTDEVSGIKCFDVYMAVDEGTFQKWQSGTDETSADFAGGNGHSYEFYSIATDNAGNVQAMAQDWEIVKVTIDISAPVTDLGFDGPIFGAGPTFVAPTTMICLCSNDFSGQSTTYYNIDDRSLESYWTDINETSPGHHNLTYWSVDIAGNKESNRTLWFFVDGESPVTAESYGGPMASADGRVFVSQDTAISLVATDSGSGVNRTEYRLDNGGYKPYAGWLKLEAAGEHSIIYRSFDNLGNAEPEKTLKVIVDKSPPATRGTASSVLSSEDIVVYLNATDSGSGVGATYYRVMRENAAPGNFLNGTRLTIEAGKNGNGDGNYTIQYFSADIVRNDEPIRELELEIDTIAILRISGGGHQSTGNDRITLKGRAEPGADVTVNGDQVSVSDDGSFSAGVGLNPGSNKVKIEATDQAGNTAAMTVEIDCRQPMPVIGRLAVASAIAVAAAVGAGFALQKRRKRIKGQA